MLLYLMYLDLDSAHSDPCAGSTVDLANSRPTVDTKRPGEIFSLNFYIVTLVIIL